jgi:hypothetical protein
MNMSRTTAMLVSVVVSGAALAEETGAAKVPTRETYPAALVERPLTLAAGVADVAGTLALDLDRLAPALTMRARSTSMVRSRAEYEAQKGRVQRHEARVLVADGRGGS